MEHKNRSESVDTFGSCPECFGNDGFLNLGRNHWFVCRIHRTRWCIGSNWFGWWREETAAEWKANWEEIRDFREVEPIFGPLVTLPKGVRDSLQEILSHFLGDEERDYKASEEKSARHIFFDLHAIDWWLERLEKGGDDV